MEPVVEKRNRGVHDENSEAHTFWIRTEVPDHQCDETDTYTEDDSTLSAHRTGNVVSRHEAGTEKETTGEEVEQRIGELRGISEPEDAGHGSHGTEDRQGDPRLDDLARDQVDETD